MRHIITEDRKGRVREREREREKEKEDRTMEHQTTDLTQLSCQLLDAATRLSTSSGGDEIHIDRTGSRI